jgi:hypothetical protein
VEKSRHRSHLVLGSSFVSRAGHLIVASVFRAMGSSLRRRHGLRVRMIDLTAI